MEMRIFPFRIPSKALKTFLSYFVSYLFCSPLDMALNFFVLYHCWGKKVFFFEIPYLRCSWKSCELFLLKSSQIYRGITVFFNQSAWQLQSFKVWANMFTSKLWLLFGRSKPNQNSSLFFLPHSREVQFRSSTFLFSIAAFVEDEKYEMYVFLVDVFVCNPFFFKNLLVPKLESSRWSAKETSTKDFNLNTIGFRPLPSRSRWWKSRSTVVFFERQFTK